MVQNYWSKMFLQLAFDRLNWYGDCSYFVGENIHQQYYIRVQGQNCLKFWTITSILPSLAPDIDIVYMSFVSYGKESTIT